MCTLCVHECTPMCTLPHPRPSRAFLCAMNTVSRSVAVAHVPDADHSTRYRFVTVLRLPRYLRLPARPPCLPEGR